MIFDALELVLDTKKLLNMQFQAQWPNLTLFAKSTCEPSVLIPEVFSYSKTSSWNLNTLKYAISRPNSNVDIFGKIDV